MAGARAASLGVLLIGALVLTSWMLGWTDWLYNEPLAVSTKGITGLGLMLAGLSCWLRVDGEKRAARWVVGILAALTMVMALEILGFSAGISRLLSPRDFSAYTVTQGETSQMVVACFACVCGALWPCRACRHAVWTILVLTHLAVLGYILQAPTLFFYIRGISSGMSLLTAGALMLLGWGMISAFDAEWNERYKSDESSDESWVKQLQADELERIEALGRQNALRRAARQMAQTRQADRYRMQMQADSLRDVRASEYYIQ